MMIDDSLQSEPRLKPVRFRMIFHNLLVRALIFAKAANYVCHILPCFVGPKFPLCGMIVPQSNTTVLSTLNCTLSGNS